MTTRRLPHTPAAPHLTGGDDRPRPNCDGNWAPFDVLVDLTAGPAFQRAVRDAREMCGGCPLMATCLRDNSEEPWARAVMGLPASERIANANAAKSAAARKKWDDKRAARLDDLRDLMAAGVTREDMPGRLGMTPSAFGKWMGKYARDEWQQLLKDGDPRYGNQHRRSDLGTISTRRKKVAA